MDPTTAMASRLMPELTAAGYAVTKQIMDGLANQGGEIFLQTLALIYLAWKTVDVVINTKPITDLAKAVAITFAAFMLFYAKPTVSYTAIMGSQTATTQEAGTAPWPTYIVDQIGTGFVQIIQKVVANGQPVMPGAVQAVQQTAYDSAAAADPNILANNFVWRTQVLPALIKNNPALATKLQQDGLTALAYNPTTNLTGYQNQTNINTVNQVVADLNSTVSPAQFAYTLCSLQPYLVSGAHSFGADSAITLKSGSCTGNGSARFVANVYSTRTQLYAGSATTSMMPPTVPISSPGDYYQSMGNAEVMVYRAHMQSDPELAKELDAACAETGKDTCGQLLNNVNSAVSQRTASDNDASNTVPSELAGGISGIILKIFAVVAYVVTAFIMAVMPAVISIAKMFALILSVVGIFVMLIPGREVIGLEWMIAPITWVNVWNVLYLLFWKVSTNIDKVGALIDASGLDQRIHALNTTALISIVEAAGYIELPVIAWHIVFRSAGALSIGAAAGGFLAGEAFGKSAKMAMSGGKMAYKAVKSRSSDGSGDSYGAGSKGGSLVTSSGLEQSSQTDAQGGGVGVESSQGGAPEIKENLDDSNPDRQDHPTTSNTEPA